MTFQLESQFLVIASMSEVIAIRRIAKEMAHEMGFSETDREEIGLAVSELASNIVKHAGRGLLTLTPVAETQRCGLMIEVEDEGLGFAFEECFRDGVSSSGTLGVGLGAVNRLMDEFTLAKIENKQGMRIVCKRWLRDHSTQWLDCPLNYGVLSRPKLSEHVKACAKRITCWRD
jgi:anti-sigma regulatory factor (Ser/Thr protein kinase)